jgi:hypothetical protein
LESGKDFAGQSSLLFLPIKRKFWGDEQEGRTLNSGGCHAHPVSGKLWKKLGLVELFLIALHLILSWFSHF